MIIAQQTSFLLVAFLAMAASMSMRTNVDQGTSAADAQSCDNLRREMAAMFQQMYRGSSPEMFTKTLMPKWVEMSLPVYCDRQWNQSPATDSAQPPIVVDGIKVNGAEPATPNGGDAAQSHGKRFGGMPDVKTLPQYGLSSSQVTQIKEFAQMILNHFMRFGKQPQSHNAPEGIDVVGSNMLGGIRPDATPSMAVVDRNRQKRFLFGEPAEGPFMPSLFSIMAGTATDPNTGKRLEFGGDVMNTMMANTYMSFLSPFTQPTPGKEAPELIKVMAPVWYFSNLQQAMNPSPKIAPKSTNSQKRTPGGYYGDSLPAKSRRKRNSEGSKDINTDVIGINDALIPIELFQAHDSGKEEEKGYVNIEVVY